ncbi:MAG: type II toxin-antitoxin system RelE/ParE family toxin [Gammaproteobacteria bacterium]|nr:type II toxin-antitoxin system RelE/ParE family toxin [Gammaproteobacteria bacterium]MYD02026.1 type II toxin-antitoxin system RelE/ParE family toxin [Gammaproteobacteria bacterium]MYI24043.1 type II toxin-antitoxin system RelE/ParE family toxin [Gammaproteobacteria bacterium]
MAWTIEYTATALNQLQKLDKQAAHRILAYMSNRVARLTQPRDMGKSLTGPLARLWRYRVGDYRVICDIQTSALRVLVIRVARRDKAYR